MNTDNNEALEDIRLGQPERANKTYRFVYRNGEYDEETGYLVVTPDFVAVCRGEGEVHLISPMDQITRVRPVEPVAGRA